MRSIIALARLIPGIDNEGILRKIRPWLWKKRLIGGIMYQRTILAVEKEPDQGKGIPNKEVLKNLLTATGIVSYTDRKV